MSDAAYNMRDGDEEEDLDDIEMDVADSDDEIDDEQDEEEEDMNEAPPPEPVEEDVALARRRAIQTIMRDTTLSDAEKRMRIQNLMSGGRTEVAPPPAPVLPAPEANAACVHYERNCNIVAPCCQRIYGCRICHDELSPANHPDMNRFLIREVVCKNCNQQQAASNQCSNCQTVFGEYHCGVCNLWMSMVCTAMSCLSNLSQTIVFILCVLRLTFASIDFLNSPRSPFIASNVVFAELAESKPFAIVTNAACAFQFRFLRRISASKTSTRIIAQSVVKICSRLVSRPKTCPVDMPFTLIASANLLALTIAVLFAKRQW